MSAITNPHVIQFFIKNGLSIGEGFYLYEDKVFDIGNNTLLKMEEAPAYPRGVAKGILSYRGHRILRLGIFPHAWGFTFDVSAWIVASNFTLKQLVTRDLDKCLDILERKAPGIAYRPDLSDSVKCVQNADGSYELLNISTDLWSVVIGTYPEDIKVKLDGATHDVKTRGSRLINTAVITKI